MLNIVHDGQGQMCNKLLFLAQILASGYHRNFKVNYYNFHKYEGIAYDNPNLNKIFNGIEEPHKYEKLIAAVSKISMKLPRKKLPKILRINVKKEAEILEKYFAADYFSKQDLWWYGWPYMDYVSLRENVELLRDFFRFTPEIDKIAEANLEHENYDRVYGIHMRRGDYKEWLGGKYYFSDQVYERIMKEIAELEKNKKIKIILFSNEPISLSDGVCNENVEIVCSENSAMIDLCMLSKCDCLIGPPSTFSGWASFVGNKKRFVLDFAEKSFDLKRSYVWLTETDGWGIPLDE